MFGIFNCCTCAGDKTPRSTTSTRQTPRPKTPVSSRARESFRSFRKEGEKTARFNTNKSDFNTAYPPKNPEVLQQLPVETRRLSLQKTESPIKHTRQISIPPKVEACSSIPQLVLTGLQEISLPNGLGTFPQPISGTPLSSPKLLTDRPSTGKKEFSVTGLDLLQLDSHIVELPTKSGHLIAIELQILRALYDTVEELKVCRGVNTNQQFKLGEVISLYMEDIDKDIKGNMSFQGTMMQTINPFKLDYYKLARLLNSIKINNKELFDTLVYLMVTCIETKKEKKANFLVALLPIINNSPFIKMLFQHPGSILKSLAEIQSEPVQSKSHRHKAF
jgi:hypothetical protein